MKNVLLMVVMASVNGCYGMSKHDQINAMIRGDDNAMISGDDNVMDRVAMHAIEKRCSCCGSKYSKQGDAMRLEVKRVLSEYDFLTKQGQILVGLGHDVQAVKGRVQKQLV